MKSNNLIYNLLIKKIQKIFYKKTKIGFNIKFLWHFNKKNVKIILSFKDGVANKFQCIKF